jgi:hypothetical protein
MQGGDLISYVDVSLTDIAHLKNVSGIIWINLDQQNFHSKSQGRLSRGQFMFLSGAQPAQLPKIAMMFFCCFWLTKIMKTKEVDAHQGPSSVNSPSTARRQMLWSMQR